MPITRPGPAIVPVLFLDLDGTVRHGYDQLGRFVNDPKDVVVFPEAVDRMCEWKAAGGRIVGISNQGGIALGKVTGAAVEAAMDRTVKLTTGTDTDPFMPLFEFISYCPHHPDSGRPACWCRKPKPGLIYGAINLLEQGNFGQEIYPPDLCVMVGDRPEDEECAENADISFLNAEEWRAGALTIADDRIEFVATTTEEVPN